MPAPRFDQLLGDALAAPFVGWDFSWLGDRVATEPLPWSYPVTAAELADGEGPMLDMGTAGGEVLAGLPSRPGMTVATEAWPPNVPVAAGRLARLGIPVVQAEGAADNTAQDEPAGRDGQRGSRGRLPFRAGAFRTVINRHEAFAAAEVSRVLASGGLFVTQQVDGGSDDDFRDALGLARRGDAESWLPLARDQAERAGLRVTESRTAQELLRFTDIGALAYYLRAVPWVVPESDVTALLPALRRLHEQMRDAPFTARQPRFLLIARKP